MDGWRLIFNLLRALSNQPTHEDLSKVTWVDEAPLLQRLRRYVIEGIQEEILPFLGWSGRGRRKHPSRSWWVSRESDVCAMVRCEVRKPRTVCGSVWLVGCWVAAGSSLLQRRQRRETTNHPNESVIYQSLISDLCPTPIEIVETNNNTHPSEIHLRALPSTPATNLSSRNLSPPTET